MNGTWSLRTRELAIGHGQRSLLNGLEFGLRAGEISALIGANGSGKTTLLKTLAGLHLPLAGDVFIEDVPLSAMSARLRARRVSLVLTGRPQTGLMDVETLVALGRQPWTNHWGTLTAADRSLVDDALRDTGADHLRRKALRTCSDGECQKVLIARALAQDTPVLLLDEPTAYLDLPNRAAIVRVLRRIAGERGKAVLFSTHDLQLAMDLCDRLLVLHQARIWSGTPTEAITSGRLTEAFTRDGIRFDPASGTHRFERS